MSSTCASTETALQKAHMSESDRSSGPATPMTVGIQPSNLLSLLQTGFALWEVTNVCRATRTLKGWEHGCWQKTDLVSRSVKQQRVNGGASRAAISRGALSSERSRGFFLRPLFPSAFFIWYQTSGLEHKAFFPALTFVPSLVISN